MKYTKEQLQAMSDFDVNKVLTKLITGYGLPASCCLDYCNTPNDIMPLAFEYELNIHKTRCGDPEWMCSSRTNRYYEDLNPLRAIACCLILVLQELNA